MKPTITKREFSKIWTYNDQVRIYTDTWKKFRQYTIQEKNQSGTWDTVATKITLKDAKAAAERILEDIEKGAARA